MKFVKRHRVLTVCLILVLAFWGWRNRPEACMGR